MNLSQSADCLTAVLPREIDHHCATAIREEIDRAMLAQMPKTVILDFTEVSFMDSSGMGLVMGRYKKAQEIGARVKVAGASGRVGAMLNIAGITKLVEMEWRHDQK